MYKENTRVMICSPEVDTEKNKSVDFRGGLFESLETHALAIVIFLQNGIF